MYDTINKAIWHAQRDNWAKVKGFAVVRINGKYDYIYTGTPMINGEQMLARYAFIGNRWRRYEWCGRGWTRVK